jgi:hypothetical protein
MENVTANQPFYGSREEGMWAAGDTKEVKPERAKELRLLGLVDDSPAEKEEKEPRSTKEDKAHTKTKDAK